MSESSLALGANTSAFTIGARAPKSSVLSAASASRSAPRPRGTGSSTRIRRTTSRPMSPPRSRPLHFPATTHVVPPRAAWSSGQRRRTEPPHVPGRTSASTIPPRAGAGSASRTITARVCPSPALPPAAHRPVHVASRSRTAAAPQSIPATPMIPTAAPSGARAASQPEVATSDTATPHNAAPGNTKGVNPPPQADPDRYAKKKNRRPHPPPPSGSHQLHRLRPAARRQPHLAEPLEQRHVQLGFLLIAVQSQLHQHFALGRGHVVRREAIEREHEDISAARLAAAEPGQLGTQLRIFPLHDLERHVRHPTTASSSPLPLPCTRPSGTAVKVEPVVPVKRTSWYPPIQVSGPGMSATLLVRVRPCSRSPRLAHPSTSTSCVLPTRATFLRRAMPRTAATRRSRRSPATASGTGSLSRVAGVASRGEYLKVYASSNPTSATRDSVSWKSASVSPGNPTMMSLVRAMPGTAPRSAAPTSR